MKHMHVGFIAVMLWLNGVYPSRGADIGSAVGFDQSPRLQQATVANRVVTLTITIPEQAGEKLAQLSLSDSTIGSRVGEIAQIPFDLTQTKAFWGYPHAIGQTIPIDQAWVDETGVVWIGFAPSLPPGTTFTVALTVLPQLASGSRPYGIAAYPDADHPIPAFVGDRTLTFASP